MADRELLTAAVRRALEMADELGEMIAACHLSTALDVLDRSAEAADRQEDARLAALAVQERAQAIN